jgi:multidrug resistance efflux pump
MEMRVSATARDHPAVRSPPAIAFNFKRLLKLALACGVLSAGVYAIWSAQGFVVSDNAVVSAYVTSLRTPIEGFVSVSHAPVGSEIALGAILATVTNPRVDDQRLTTLQYRLRRLQLEQAAITRQRDALETTWRELTQRAEEYRRAMISQLSGQLEAAKTALAARRAEREQAKRDYARKDALVRSGTASAADLDRAHYAFDALDYQAQSLAGQLAAVQARLDAAIHGVTIDAGGNDVAYSAQRADEVRLRLVELDRALDAATGDADESASLLAGETHRIALLRSAEMTAPSAGMLWKVGSSNGERLGAGDTTAELVDCGAEFLVVSIPQSSYADVVRGGEARFRLSSETDERTGAIISVTGDASLIGDRNLAAVPSDQHRPAAMVRIAVPPSHNLAAECLVGRTAHVLLPTLRRGLADRAMGLVQRIF